MPYTCQRLQFGENHKRVPGYEEDLELSNKYAQIAELLIDPAFNPPQDQIQDFLWGLVFSYESGQFYLANNKQVPGQDGATVKSWYAKGGGPGPNSLTFTPFIIGDDCTEGFALGSKFVDFSEPSAADNSVNTDTINHQTVTATVHSELPEYKKVEFSTHATSNSIIITTKTRQVVFDRIFVYAGSSVPIDNEITVQKGKSCFALAVFKCVTSSSLSEISTTKWPKIPKWEWPMIISVIIKEILVEGNGEIFEHLSPKVIAETEPEALKKAIASITRRITKLEKIKTVIAGLAERKSK